MMTADESARIPDVNGWYEIKANPLSKVGVFPYAGFQLGLTGEDAEKIFNVYRPEEELADQACIDSFKLVPWIDDHEFLGAESDGLTPAERAGIQGVVGEDVFFADGYLKGNIKVFSDTLGKLIESGKRELSCGYRCVYDMVSGVFNGEHYDAIQREIRGNHLALVQEGRMGKDVAVLDHFTFTIDAREAVMADEEMKKEGADADAVTLEALAERMAKLEEFITKLAPLEKEEHGAALDKEPAEEDATDKCEAADTAAEVKALKAKLAKLQAIDSKSLMTEISRRDQLAKSLSFHVGTFDHAEMTLQDVAQYGVKKLGIACDSGQELSAITGYLHGREPKTVSTDSAVQPRSASVDAYLSR